MCSRVQAGRLTSPRSWPALATTRRRGGSPPPLIWRIPLRRRCERATLVAERGLLDAVFFADSPGLEIFRARYFPQVGFDPLETARGALARSTAHVGLIATASTTYSAPYDLARRFSTIDHLSGGRPAGTS